MGLDLEAAEDDLLVAEGDFHNIDARSGSLDVVFTNSWDHAFDLSRAVGEAWRVLKPGGLLIVEAPMGRARGAHVDPWDCLTWENVGDLVEYIVGFGFEVVGKCLFEFPWTGLETCLRKR